MQLVIAEKPSVARNIAKVLHATNVKDGYLEGKEYLVSWCIGHLIELASADQYRDDWKAWKYETLPMIPENWKYQIKESTKGQFRVLKELLHRADITEVICATDLEQQEGRILRQGNKNKKVKIFRYITENTFDAYSWQLIENKQKFIGQIMTSKSPVRSCQDVDEAALSYAEVKALATGNPKIKEKMDLDVQVTKLKMLKANYESNLFRLQDAIAVEYPEKIAKYEELTTAYDSDIKHIDTVLNTPFLMEIHGVTYNDEKAAGEMLVQACTQMKKAHADAENIGSFRGFQMKISYSLFDNSFYVRLTREASFIVEVKKDPVRNIERILTAMRNLPGQKKTAEERLEDARQQLVQAKEEVQKPFEKEEELKFIQARLVKVNAELDVGSDEEKIQKDGKNRQEEQRICL